MLLQAPPPVVDGVLGYSTGKAETIVAEAGATYSRYAAGDHARPPGQPRSHGDA